MKFIVKKSNTKGKVFIPGSKSHTIRALYIASLANGESTIKEPLFSADTQSAINICRAFGAQIRNEQNAIIVQGFNGAPKVPDNILDVGNSGTTLRIGLSTAALIEGISIFTGDEQIRNRPLDSLITALINLGAEVITNKNNGKAPVIIKGKAEGGSTTLDAVTSQYLTSLLINAPLFAKDTEITVTNLNEKPYVDLTLQWLNKQNIRYKNEDYKKFIIYGNQSYKAFSETIPGDFSSACFFFALGALSENGITITNLDFSDVQGDKRVIYLLQKMGAYVEIDNRSAFIRGGKLRGIEIDMNDIPDALPIMAVIGCFAEGETTLFNVPQARLKETDRIKMMNLELSKMGANIKELPDGLVIQKSKLKGCAVDGHSDHRIVMALAIAGLNIHGETIIDSAESASVTFPNFFTLIKSCNGKITTK